MTRHWEIVCRMNVRMNHWIQFSPAKMVDDFEFALMCGLCQQTLVKRDNKIIVLYLNKKEERSRQFFNCLGKISHCITQHLNALDHFYLQQGKTVRCSRRRRLRHSPTNRWMAQMGWEMTVRRDWTLCFGSKKKKQWNRIRTENTVAIKSIRNRYIVIILFECS